MEERPQRQPSEDDEPRERERRRNEGADQRRAEPAPALAREGARHDEQRRDGEILEKQHRERRPPDRRAEALAFDENRDDDRGRRHAERGADGQRRRRLEAEPPGDCRQDKRGDDDLSVPEPEHQPPHAPQAFERQLESIANKSVTTPKAAILSMVSTLLMASAPSHGAFLASEPSP